MPGHAVGMARPHDGPAASITACEDGPLLVRGEFALQAQDGTEIDARRGTVALCRCGASAIRPFCDGTHARIRFRAPSGREGEPPAEPPVEPPVEQP